MARSNHRAGTETVALSELELEPGVAEALYEELQIALAEARRLNTRNRVAGGAEGEHVTIRVHEAVATRLNRALGSVPVCCISRTNPCPGDPRCGG